MTHDACAAHERPREWRMTRRLALGVALLVVAASPALGQAGPPSERPQQPRRQETIEIRGQVPTPQVVTVRPREAPAYNRRVLVPAFLDRDFWSSILPPLHVVTPVAPPRADSTSRPDSTLRSPADSAGRAPATPPRPAGIPPAPPR